MELVEKLETALLNPVIRKEERAGGRQLRYLRERGYAEIVSEGFRIDGRLYGAQEFADMLSVYEGLRMNWQVQDALTEIPDRDTCWLLVRITDELLLDELDLLILSASGSREFLSYKDMNAFDFGFESLMEKLKLYCRNNPPGVGKVARLKLIRRLEELETDDDMFPEYHVGIIRELIGDTHGW